MVSLLISSNCLAQLNLLENSDFSSSLSSWTILFGRDAVWDSRDRDDSSSSGSALITNDIPGNGATPLVLEQCKSVIPGEQYTFGADVLLPEGQADATARARTFLGTYTSADCSDGLTAYLSGGSAGASSSADWQRVSGSYVAETGINSVGLNFGIGKLNGVTDSIVAYFDNAFLSLSDELFSDGFE